MTSSRLHPFRPNARAYRHLCVALLATIVLIGSIVPGIGEAQLSLYTYRDTQSLVSLVEDAAALVEQKGENAFKEFARKDSKWLHDDYYIFVYALDGTCIFHPITPELIGKNVIDLRDMNGKPIIRQITEVGRKPAADANGWVFYLWENQTQLTPSWKSTYVRKVIAPNGQTYVVGSGSYNIKIEKVFIEERVRMAADLLKALGKDQAFRQLQDPASPFVFLDAFIFVMDERGRTVVDPAFPTMGGRDLSEFKDAVGFYAIRELLNKLARADEGWVQYLWPKPGSPVAARKLVYARKVTIDGEALIVGSDFFLATPIWMKVEDNRAWPNDPPG